MIEASGLKMIAVEDFDLAARTVSLVGPDVPGERDSTCTIVLLVGGVSLQVMTTG